MRGLWLIDGSYIYKTSKNYQKNNPDYSGKGIDYKKLKDAIKTEFKLSTLDSYYFNSTTDPTTDAQNAYHNWLKRTEPNGPNIRVKLYKLKTKKIKCSSCQQTFDTRIQKGVDVGIATFALRYFSQYDAIILAAGDGDFEDFIRYIVQDNGKDLYIVGFDDSISTDLQQYSSKSYLLNEHYSEICDARLHKPFDAADDLDD